MKEGRGFAISRTGMGAAVSRIGTYSDISETIPRQQSPLLQKPCICHRLSFLGATLSTSYRWKLYEPRIVPWNAVARDCCSKKIAKIYLYDPFEIPLLREITATRVSNIQISSSLLLPFSFLLFFFSLFSGSKVVSQESYEGKG